MADVARAFAALSIATLASVDALAEPPPERQEELLHRLRQDCGSCHGMTLKGGLGPPLLPADLAGKDDRALVDTILYGRPGTPMPPWDFEISAAEAGWLVGQLKEGAADDR
jgi:cytochrome c55X